MRVSTIEIIDISVYNYYFYGVAIATSSIFSLTTTATSLTSSLDGKRLNTSTTHLKRVFTPQTYSKLSILPVGGNFEFIKLQQVF